MTSDDTDDTELGLTDQHFASFIGPRPSPSTARHARGDPEERAARRLWVPKVPKVPERPLEMAAGWDGHVAAGHVGCEMD